VPAPPGRKRNFSGRPYSFCVSFHRRRLPHWHPDGTALFLIWHLHGSLPHSLYPPPQKASSGQAFVWMDRYLNAARSGPMFLRQQPVAELVRSSLNLGRQMGHYELHAWVIMANHVHALLTPLVHPSRLIASLQSEGYDRWVRNEEEFHRIRFYIENNPVKAGMAVNPAAFPWSSAHVCLEESRHGSHE
jgi:putative transposase